MDSTESPLDVLSRAATMVQGNSLLPSYDEARSYSKFKEVIVSSQSGGKWRRERKQKSGVIPPPEYTAHKGRLHQEPIDMSTRRIRGSPPSYSQSVCGVRYGTRPSVITFTQQTTTPSVIPGGVCDPVIDEHFRRSLGKDYLSLFSDVNGIKKSSNLTENNHSEDAGSSLSVDDHFAKALGDTWLKLQRGETKPPPLNTPSETFNSDEESNSLRHCSEEVMRI
uniref:Transcription cofactor vestigial-like protein 4 n=1 Tax=Clastoptera arizonana TaxID=38151 RepID=A0A1B6C9M0_9HEMI